MSTSHSTGAEGRGQRLRREQWEQELPGLGWGWVLPPQQARETLLLGDSRSWDRLEFTFCAPEMFPVSQQAGDASWIIRCLVLLCPEETAAGVWC